MGTTILRQDTFASLSPDVTVAIDWERSIRVTDHPVEAGGSVTDHAQALPDRFTIEALVSHAAPPDALDPIPGRMQRAVDFMEDLTGVLLTVQTDRYGSKSDCLLERFSHRTDDRMHLRFVASFKAVRLATAGLVDIPPEISEHASGLDAGAQSGTSTTSGSQTDAANTSVLAGALSAIGAL